MDKRLIVPILMYFVGVGLGWALFSTDKTSTDKLSKICAIVQADSDYIDNDSELYKACEGI